LAKQIINKIPMKVSDLKHNPRNPRKITDERLTMLEKSMRQFGDLSGIVFNAKTGQLVGGHQRSKKINGAEEIVIEQRLKKKTSQGTIAFGHVDYEGERFAVRVVDWDQKTEKAANIAANKHGGMFDLEILSEDLLELDAANFDMELTGFTKEDMENLFAPTGGTPEEESEPEISVYTKKIKVPIYEPTGENPPVVDLYSREKTNKLVKEIEDSGDLPEEIRLFLVNAAQRHTVFNYDKIAEFYAHAPAKIQNLMERSALVLIDFGKAIEEGFVVMTKEIAEQYTPDAEADDEE
jgi:hypothetical protein